MAPFIFKRRNLIHIIDLRATLRGLITSRKLAEAIVRSGQYVLFVGTKKQAKGVIKREAARCGMPYVAERWPGGLLTNYVTVRERLDRLEELEGLEKTGQIRLYSKKMVSAFRREQRKILRNLGGVRNMERLPGLLVVVDPAEERIAIREANKLGIPVIALSDTDANPDAIDVVVPGNDDSIGAVEIFVRTISEAAITASGVQPSAGAEAAVEEAPGETAPESQETEPVEESAQEEQAADVPDSDQTPAAAEDPGQN
jgi:small subunit ribosomal protein S2